MGLAYQKIEDRALCEPHDHYDFLHRDAHGTALVWERQASGRRWQKLRPNSQEIPAILSGQHGGNDRYMSVNQFHGWRVVRQLRSLRSCFVDIDGYTDLSGALDACAAAMLPGPTHAVYSGRGLHLYWLHDPVPAQALPAWQRVQAGLIDGLTAQGLPVDGAVRDCARVLRLVGSRHGVTGDQVHGVVLKPWAWSLRTLADEVLGQRPPKPAEVRSLDAARVRAGRQTRTATGSIYEWWHHVYRDLIRIGDDHLLGIPEGFRDKWLFLYAVALSWFTEPATLAAEVERVAHSYTPGLRIGEVRDAIAPTLERAQMAQRGETIEWNGQQRDARYWFKRRTLLDWMQPIIGDHLTPELRAIVPDQVRQERRQEREDARWGDRYTGDGVKASNEQKRATARILKAQGQSLRAIAAELSVSIDTARRWTA